MPTDLLQRLIDGDQQAAQEIVEFILPSDCAEIGFCKGASWVERRLRMIEKDPDQHAWMYRAIVRKDDSRMVGYISFHHKAPDPDLREYSNFAAELGYAIAPEHRRKGYATESAVAMMEWANREHRVNEFILTISPSNLPSLRMAERMFFAIVGEKDDPEDGLEYFMMANIAGIRKTRKAYQGAVGNE